MSPRRGGAASLDKWQTKHEPQLKLRVSPKRTRENEKLFRAFLLLVRHVFRQLTIDHEMSAKIKYGFAQADQKIMDTGIEPSRIS